jgi:hypothetical protein
MSNLTPLTPIPPVLSDRSAMNQTAPMTSAASSVAAPELKTPSAVALSFTFDCLEKTLNVVMTDERSGEVVRTIEFSRLPADIHHNDRLNGLLLDQFA